MRLDGNGQLALPHLGSYALTVLQDKPTAQTEPGQCCRPGDITKIYVATSISTGDYVATDATGQAIYAVTGDIILGQSLDKVTVNGIARMVFQPMGKL